MKVIFVCVALLAVVCSASLFGEGDNESSLVVEEDLSDDAVVLEQNGGSENSLDAKENVEEDDNESKVEGNKMNDDRNGQSNNAEYSEGVNVNIGTDNNNDEEGELDVWGRPSDVLVNYWKNFVMNKLREKEKKGEAARNEPTNGLSCGPLSCVISCMESNQYTGFCRGEDCVCY